MGAHLIILVINLFKMTRFTEPYYIVDFNSSVCNFDIFINDLPAFTHHVGGGISSHTPINHFILESGIQNIKLNILPLKGETSLRSDGFFKIKIFSYDSSTGQYDNINEVFRYEQDFSQSDVPVKNVINEFKAEINYKIPGWQISESLDPESVNKNEIVSYFKLIYEMFKEKNIDGIYHEMKDKFGEIDTSLYLGNVDNKVELSTLFEELDGGKYILEEFPASTELMFFADNKVYTIVRTGGNPIIRYYNKQTNEEFLFPVLIHKKNESYRIIR